MTTTKQRYIWRYIRLFIYWCILCQVSEDKEAKQIVDCAKKALITELKREVTDIQELRWIQWEL